MTNKKEATKTTTSVSSGFMPKGKLRTIKNGSTLNPQSSDLRFVLDLCAIDGNVQEPQKAIQKRWPSTRQTYKGWYVSRNNFKMGTIVDTAVSSDIWVMHCLCVDKDGAVDEKALGACLKEVAKKAKSDGGSLHIEGTLVEAVPSVKDVLEEAFIKAGLNVYLYE